MRNRPEQIHTKLLTLCQDCRHFLLPRILFIFQCKRRFSKNRNQNIMLKSVRRCILRLDSNHTINSLIDSQCKIHIFCIRKCTCSRTGKVIIFKHPVHDFFLILIIITLFCIFIFLKEVWFLQFFIFHIINNNIPAQQFHNLYCSNMENFIMILRFR